MEIKDLAGLSQPLTKLVEVVSAGIGNLFKPTLMKRLADAKGYEIRQIASAVNDAQNLLGKAEYKTADLTITPLDAGPIGHEALTLEARTNARVTYQEKKKQENIEQISQYAAQQLQDVDRVSNEKLDDDWVSHFFEVAPTISSVEMQKLWGKILAGEISKPGSYSLRTLAFLRTLSKKEAEIFTKFAHYAMRVSRNERAFLIDPEKDDDMRRVSGISFVEILLMRELGLVLTDSGGIRQVIEHKTGKQASHLRYSNALIVVESTEAFQKELPIVPFSTIGNELLTLIVVPFAKEYVGIIANHLIDETTKVRFGFITKEAEDGSVIASHVSEVLIVYDQPNELTDTSRVSISDHQV